jgi:hypothetical protein
MRCSTARKGFRPTTLPVPRKRCAEAVLKVMSSCPPAKRSHEVAESKHLARSACFQNAPHLVISTNVERSRRQPHGRFAITWSHTQRFLHSAIAPVEMTTVYGCTTATQSLFTPRPATRGQSTVRHTPHQTQNKIGLENQARFYYLPFLILLFTVQQFTIRGFINTAK